jgi:hypothetical protein
VGVQPESDKGDQDGSQLLDEFCNDHLAANPGSGQSNAARKKPNGNPSK